MDLSGYDFSHANLSGADFQEAISGLISATVT